MARAIDKDYLLTHKRKVRFFGIGPDDESWGYAVPVEVIENTPILTPPNEPLTCKGCDMQGEKVAPCASCIRDPRVCDYYTRRPPEGMG